MMASDLWTFQNPVFSFYTLCAAVLLFKTLFMAVWTGYMRITYKSFKWPEDRVRRGLKAEDKPPHPAVERAGRCHDNDLENNIPFVLIGLLYTLTNPSVLTAKLLLGGFTVFRLAHTFIFLNQVPQPFRFLSFLFALIINFVMLISIIIHVLPQNSHSWRRCSNMASDLWTLQNPVFSFYTLCSAVMLFKTIFMGILTSFTRVRYKNFSWAEDRVHVGLKADAQPPHPVVERIRRCHQNDLENNIPFVLIGLFYTLTNPSVFCLVDLQCFVWLTLLYS